MNSTRLRPLQNVSNVINAPPVSPSAPPLTVPITPKKSAVTYAVGEKCMAKWTDSRKWKATVQAVLENGNTFYLLLFMSYLIRIPL